MRHRKQGRKLGRTSAHRTAMLRNLVSSLFMAEADKSGVQRVVTTLPKAKEARRLAERVITLAKKGSLADRRRAVALLGNKKAVIQKVFSEIAPRYMDRPGGYTRIVRLAEARLGDNGPQAFLELVGAEEESKQGRRPAGKQAAEPARTGEPAQQFPASETAGGGSAPAQSSTDETSGSS